MEKPRILIVDDEPVILRNMAYILGEYGFETDTAAKASEALELMLVKDYAMVITDVQLPDMNGADMIAEVCRQKPGVRFLIHTGAHDFELTEELAACGINRGDILLKPIPSIREQAERLHKELGTT